MATTFRAGIDIGGTFTDLVAITASGDVVTRKGALALAGGERPHVDRRAGRVAKLGQHQLTGAGHQEHTVAVARG